MSYRKLFKIAVPIVLVCAIAASLWFVSPLPARALEIEITNAQGTAAPTSGTIGSLYNFRVKVKIEDDELLPIKNIDLKIYYVADSVTYCDEYTNLSLVPQDYTPASGTSATALIKATPDSTWGYYATGTGNVIWNGTGYTFPTTTGGYGYVVGTGTTSITYDIQWTPPSNWPAGGYKIDAKITSYDSQTFTQTSSQFALAAPSPPPSGGGGGPPKTEVIVVGPGVVDVSDVINLEGEFEQNVTIESADEKVELDIDEGTVGKTKENEPLSEISILEMEEPPEPPKNASIIGLTYDLGPDEATFDPPITITFTYDPDDIPEGVNEEDLVIAIWNEATGRWVEFEDCTVNPVTNKIKASINHFTPFAVIAHIPVPPPPPAPAAFTTSDLTISPIDINIGESVTISVMVTNTGDLPGSYNVVLKIDGAVLDTKMIGTLAGGDSMTVPFFIVKDIAGIYTVNVDTLSGTFTVTGPLAPAVFTTSDLTISPTEVEIGQSVDINVVVTNTGDITGSHEVIVNIDNVVVATKVVVLAGRTSQTVTFTTSRDIAGAYTVNVNGVSGTFTINGASVKATPAEPQASAGTALWVWVIVGICTSLAIGFVFYFLWWSQRI